MSVVGVTYMHHGKGEFSRLLKILLSKHCRKRKSCSGKPMK